MIILDSLSLITSINGLVATDRKSTSFFPPSSVVNMSKFLNSSPLTFFETVTTILPIKN